MSATHTIALPPPRLRCYFRDFHLLFGVLVAIVSFFRSCKTIAKLQLYVGKTDEGQKRPRSSRGWRRCFKLGLRMEAACVFLAGAYYDLSSRSSALYANFCEVAKGVRKAIRARSRMVVQLPDSDECRSD